MSHDDDRPVGQVLSRREILALLGVAALGAKPRRLWGSVLPGQRLPACIVRPAQMEGPYFLDAMLDRADIRSEPGSGVVSPGIPLDLGFRVSRMDGSTCAPLSGVLVDIWQCDATGVYSGVKDIGGMFDTTGQQFLRGHQRTGADGQARFRTIYPGWYQGRTIHVHFKLRTDPDKNRGHEFTSQIYFDDKIGNLAAAKEPYASNRQQRMLNRGDDIFQEGGNELVLALEPVGEGYRGTFHVGMVMG